MNIMLFKKLQQKRDFYKKSFSLLKGSKEAVSYTGQTMAYAVTVTMQYGLLSDHYKATRSVTYTLALKNYCNDDLHYYRNLCVK